MDKLPERLKSLRDERDIKQEELALILHCSAATVSNYETGRHEPDLDTLAEIARFYKVSADYLLGITDCPLPIPTGRTLPFSRDYPVGRFLELLKWLNDKIGNASPTAFAYKSWPWRNADHDPLRLGISPCFDAGAQNSPSCTGAIF